MQRCFCLLFCLMYASVKHVPHWYSLLYRCIWIHSTVPAGPYHLLHWAAHPNSTTSNSINVRASIIQGWNLGNITSHFKIEYLIIHLQCKNEYNRSPLTRTPKENEILVTLTERGRVGREGSSWLCWKSVILLMINRESCFFYSRTNNNNIHTFTLF